MLASEGREMERDRRRFEKDDMFQHEGRRKEMENTSTDARIGGEEGDAFTVVSY